MEHMESSQEKDELLNRAPPTTKRGTTVHGLLGILEVTYSSPTPLDVLLQLIYRVTPRAASVRWGPEQKKVLRQV